jgi:hypothetical protein
VIPAATAITTTTGTITIMGTTIMIMGDFDPEQLD